MPGISCWPLFAAILLIEVFNSSVNTVDSMGKETAMRNRAILFDDVDEDGEDTVAIALPIPRISRAEKRALIRLSGRDPDERKRMKKRKVDDLDEDGEDTVAIALPIPRISRAEKRALIRLSGRDPNERKRDKNRLKKRKERDRSNRNRRQLTAPWRIQHAIAPAAVDKDKVPAPRPLPVINCGSRIDAITRGTVIGSSIVLSAINRRTYVFMGERVYEIRREHNMPQHLPYSISDMFPSGPRTVTAGVTNWRSGVTILFSYRTVYRYRWDRDKQRFMLAKHSPLQLSKNITFVPQTSFQWADGNVVLMQAEKFVTFDPYWNVPTFIGEKSSYFPNLSPHLIGAVFNNEHSIFYYTSSNSVQVYDLKRHRVVQEYPVNLREFLGCF